MTDFVDLGARCDRHVGEVYLPRCYDCAELNASRPAIGAGQLDRRAGIDDEPWAPTVPWPDEWEDDEA
jgi:hypothetical protein